MNFNSELQKRPYIGIGCISFIIFTLFLQLTGPYNFCYQEQWKTFIYSYSYINNLLSLPGGSMELAANYLIQFFKYPIVGILITSALLSSIFALYSSIFRRWTGNYHLLPLTLLPVISLAFLHFNINYLYSGSLSFFLMTIGIALQIRISQPLKRFLYSWLSCIFLFVVAGPISMLYACILFIMECFTSIRKGILYIILPLSIVLLGQGCLWAGWYGNWKHILLADGYFTWRLQAGSAIYLPWGTTIITFILGGIYKKFPASKKRAIYSLFIIQSLVIGTFFCMNLPQHVNKDNEVFKELNYWARHERWDQIIERCNQIPMTNLLHQNYLNLAFAEKEILNEKIHNYPNMGIQSLLFTGGRTPYLSAMLSDIYYSMGHIAFSRRYAFEANESAGNYSPKLLKRLVQTSLIYGENKLALKYIGILEKTLFYKKWAKKQRYMLEKGTEDSNLSNKRKCLFPDNRFSGSKGLDKDLEEIIKSNPNHQATAQYLEAIRLFIGNIIP